MDFKFLKNKAKAVAIVTLSTAMCASTVMGSFLVNDGVQSVQAAEETRTQALGYENVTGQVDFSNVKLSNLSDDVMVNEEGAVYTEHSVIITLDGATLSEQSNGASISEYLSTHAGKNLQNQIKSEQNQLLNSLTLMGIDYSLVTSYDTVLNGVAVKMNTAYVSTVKKLPGVKSVVLSQTYAAPQTVEEDTSAAAITNETSVYETGIYDSSAYAEQYGGRGMAVAVLDTGLDYTHEAFQKQPDSADLKYTEDEIYQIMQEANDAGMPFSATGDVFVSNKVPFAYDYADRDADVYPSYANHGTHVAGIIGGNADSYTDKDGNVATDSEGNVLPFVGAAPHCQLVICKVFTDNLDAKTVGGAETVDILDALDDCVKLGVDVINMSLGTTCGFTGTDDGDEEGRLLNETYESIKANGISLICAASNDYSSAYGGVFGTNLTSNPDSGTVGSPSTYSSALSVASISGKKSPYILANDSQAVFYRESSDENNVDYNFAEQMLGKKGEAGYQESASFNYVVIGGVGLSSDYQTSVVRNAISNAHKNGEKIIALVKRGNNTFQEKVENAKEAGADAIIIYNNVAGEIKMTIGDVEDPIPAISITLEAGEEMRENTSGRIGKITINPTDYNAGPFMSDFSSWGVTSDLKLKPEITAHGGEITSAVPGGWDEQSGTSMATPNVAGLAANIRSYINQNYSKFFTGEKDAKKITQLTNQLMMSTAVIVYDQKNLPYSPRKQGAGLANLDNIIATNAYLYTKETEEIVSAHGNYYGAVDNRSKLELGEDEGKVGEYTLKFYLNNLSGGKLSFQLNTLFMTETVSVDGLSVGEQAYMLDDEKAVWSINGKGYQSGDTVTFDSGSEIAISVTLKLSRAEKDYLDKSFANGMYVEGFVQLQSKTDGQCDLSIPFMGFYGDWEAAPMLDYDAFEIAEIEQDTSILEDEKPKASVWATQAYAVYWNDKYVLPIGSFVYKQNDDDDEVRKIYTTEEYSSISCYNDYQGEDSNNYMTSTAIKGIYAGLLRNARQVDCRMYNVATGELIYEKEVYRVNKAYTNGGSTTPGFVKLELTPQELGLVENGQYRMEFDFHYHSPEGEDVEVAEENTFEFSFYIDYSAPVLETASIRYLDYKDGNKDKQRVYLDLDIYDNHYAMAVLLCYMDTTNPENPELQLCTEYVTPVYDAKKNGTTRVSIEITDFYETYADNLYIEIDDYALNHSIYQIKLNEALAEPLPSTFNLAEGEEEITLGKYETHKVALEWDKTKYPTANLSNFTWTVTGSSASVVAVKNGEIVGLSEGTGTVTVTSGKTSKQITVHVTENGKNLNNPSISFGVILNGVKAPVKAQGAVDVNVEQSIHLDVETNPWYYTLVKELDLEWSSTNPSVASVDQEGNVTLYKKGRASVKATIRGTAYSATVTFNVEEPFKVSNYTLTGYEGSGGVVFIPTDMNIMSIGENAFKNNTEITTVIIPKTVTTIDVRAFYGCTNLKQVFFVDVVTNEIAQAKLTLINREAFAGCTSLETLDFSNCKTFTVARNAFYNCTSLKVIKGVENMGTAYDGAFENCVSLVGSLSSDSGVTLVNPEGTVRDEDERITAYEPLSFDEIKSEIQSLDVSGLHVSGTGVFANCQSIIGVTMGKFSAIGAKMFYGCKSITQLTVQEVGELGESAFENCIALREVTFKNLNGSKLGKNVFKNCGNLLTVSYENSTISSIGDYAFENTYLNAFTLPDGILTVGAQILAGTEVTNVNIPASVFETLQFSGNSFKGITLTVDGGSTVDGVHYNQDFTKIISVEESVTSVSIPATVTEIGDYAFANSRVSAIIIPATVRKIGVGAFENSALQSVTFEAGSMLTEIASGAFYNTQITSFTLPASVERVGSEAFAFTYLSSFTVENGGAEAIVFGDYVFAYCRYLVAIDLSESNITKMGDGTFMNATSLKTVQFPALQELGAETFFGALKMETLTFAEGATTAGIATFYSYQYDYATGAVSLLSYSNLTTVVLGGAMQTLGESVFINCTALESIDLKSVTQIGNYAFYGCVKLNVVEGLSNVTEIGAYAFYNAKSLKTLNLDNAETIGVSAFRIDRAANETLIAYNQIYMPKVTYIGAFAFYGNSATSIELPATLSGKLDVTVYNIDMQEGGTAYRNVIGSGAFANSASLTEFTVAEGNDSYFAQNGVLYRNAGEGEYELIAYPSGYAAQEYSIKEGTVKVGDYAFVGAKILSSVTMPYSVRAIGLGAFYDSTVTSYEFTGYTAPSLESEYDESLLDLVRADISYRGMFNMNFVDYLINYSEVNSAPIVSTLKMTYPSNGKGYDNYSFKKYFTTRKESDVVLNDDARAVKDNIENLEYGLEDVQAWNTSAFAVNDENKAIVESYSEYLKETHRLYNNVASDSAQVALITQENLDEFFAIEEALRAVKSKFNIPVRISGYAFSGSYKSAYVEGETFDKTGLVITIKYDDYSTEDFADAELSVAEVYQRPLTTLDRYVEISCAGTTVRVDVSVTKASEEAPPEEEPTPEEGDSLGLIIGLAAGGGALLLAGGAALALLFKKRAKKTTEASAEQSEDKEESVAAEDGQAKEENGVEEANETEN